MIDLIPLFLEQDEVGWAVTSGWSTICPSEMGLYQYEPIPQDGRPLPVVAQNVEAYGSWGSGGLSV